MVTSSYTFFPIAEVLKAGGEMSFDELAKKLIDFDPSRFKDEETVERAVNIYAYCLNFDGGTVKFNREAKRYAQYSIMERSIQAGLHGTIPNMERFQLYPFKARNNSEGCYLGLDWADIPESQPGESFPIACDFRGDGNDACTLACGISKDIVRRYGLDV